MNSLCHSFSRVTAAFVLACSALAAAPGLATTVSPVVIDLQTSGRGVVANISVQNTGANSLPMEIKVQPLAATATGMNAAGEDKGDLLVVPPMAIIPAGQTQSFRVQWVGDPELAESKHYYVTVAQLPVDLPEGQSAVQIVYNFQVLVSVSSPGRQPALAIRSATIGDHAGQPAPVIAVANEGGAHGYLSQHRLRVVATDPKGAEIFSKTMSGAEFQQLVGYGLVASHQVRNITLPIALPSKDGTVTAEILEERSR